MDAIRFPTGKARAALLAWVLAAVAASGVLSVLALAPAPARAAQPLRDEPIRWDAADRGNIPKPKVRNPSLKRDEFDEVIVRPVGRLVNPVRLARHVGGALWGAEVVHSAADINALDEALNSTWFTNRIGIRPVTAEEAGRGPATSDGPDRSAPWRITRAKTQGVTSGFNVKDATGTTYVVKFDPVCCNGSTTAAGVIAGRLFYTAGYNVPQDFVVEFRREDLVLAPGVQISGKHGKKRPMTEADLDTILARAPRLPDGRWRAIASQFLPGEVLGPFDWKGKKQSDPFDRVKHENRRALRGLRMICAWLAHFDVKQHNTQDVYVKEGDRAYVRHYLFDFTATLGTGGLGPFPLSNFEYGVDLSAIGGRLLGLGIHEDDWRRLTLPADMPEIGYFEAEQFDPMEWKSLEPNAAFANMTERDGYWAAKIVSAFRREHIEAAVAQGKYMDPRAAEYMVKMLEARRDKIARYWFGRVPPLDFFTWDAGRLAFHDLGAEREIYPGATARYRVRTAASDAERRTGTWSDWTSLDGPSADLTNAAVAVGAADVANAVSGAVGSVKLDAKPFLAVEVAVDRGQGFGRSIRVYVSPSSGRVIGLDR